MRELNKHYLQILRIELEDLREDIDLLMENCKKEREKGVFTDHVFFANLALFNNELLGVDVFDQIIDQTDPNHFKTLDDLIAYLKNAFDEKMKNFGIAEAIRICIERKLTKVARYVSQRSDLI